jgi:hypothetical protein
MSLGGEGLARAEYELVCMHKRSMLRGTDSFSRSPSPRASFCQESVTFEGSVGGKSVVFG